MSRPHPLLRRVGPMLGAIPILLLGLACSGLPLGGSDGEADPPPEDGEDVDPGGEGDRGEGDTASGGDEGDPEAGDRGDEGAGAGAGELAGDTLFPALDPNQAPPDTRNARIDCPDGLMPIRHPRSTLHVYCATGSGTRSGPYTEWKGRRLVIAATYVDGKLEGQWTRWERAGDAVRKVEERTYSGGVEQGDYAQWDLEGRLLVRGRMADGKRHGRFVERRVEDGVVVPGGACYRAGEELWRTADEAELVSRACAEEPEAEAEAEDGGDAGEEAVAEG